MVYFFYTQNSIMLYNRNILFSRSPKCVKPVLQNSPRWGNVNVKSLDHHNGEDTSLIATFIKRGNQEHEQFNRKLSGSRDKRCFIATSVFGVEAIETNILRQFRDKHLTPYSPRRMITSLYYSISPYSYRN